MKVVCESCSAKYQVPDARVAGKRLKIRCRRCGATVLIRGDLEFAASAASGPDGLEEGPATTVAAPAFSSAGAEWHVSIDGQVSGPFTVPELLSWLASSAVGWDAYVWREGFGEWVEARACDEIVTAAGGAPSNGVAATGTEDEVPTRMFQGPDAFVAQAQQARAQPAARANITADYSQPHVSGYSQPPRAHSSIAPASSVVPSAARAGVSQPPRLPTASQPPRAHSSIAPNSSVAGRSRPPGSSPRVHVDPAAGPIGSRSEDSVLFSTHNLRQVAQSGSQPPNQAQAGYAAGEGSGLIDIRALAQLARQMQSVPPRDAAIAEDGRYSLGDDESRALLLKQGGAFNRIDSLSPVAPVPRRGSRNSGLPLAVFGGFALLAAAAFAAIVITRAPVDPVVSQPSAAAVVSQPLAAPGMQLAAAAQPTAPEPAAAPVLVAAVAQVAEPVAPAPGKAAPEPKAAEPEAQAAEPSPKRTVAEAKSAKRHARGARTAAEDKKAPAPEEKPKDKAKEKAAPPELDDVMLAEKPAAKAQPEEKQKPAAEKADSKGSDDDLLAAKPAKAPQKDRSFDDLLDGAVVKKASPAAVAPSEDLPESPSRDQTLSAMRGVESAVRACAAADGVTGTALVELQIDGATGKVTSASASGIDAPTSGCVEKAARNAKFPRFSKPSFVVKYPYRFK